eukprot:scaffold18289_cov126-Isochrysis_galbana.AAC.4
MLTRASSPWTEARPRRARHRCAGGRWSAPAPRLAHPPPRRTRAPARAVLGARAVRTRHVGHRLQPTPRTRGSRVSPARLRCRQSPAPGLRCCPPHAQRRNVPRLARFDRARRRRGPCGAADRAWSGRRRSSADRPCLPAAHPPPAAPQAPPRTRTARRDGGGGSGCTARAAAEAAHAPGGAGAAPWRGGTRLVRRCVEPRRVAPRPRCPHLQAAPACQEELPIRPPPPPRHSPSRSRAR